jgi:hypothetical protein
VSQREIEHFGAFEPARLLAIITDCVGGSDSSLPDRCARRGSVGMAMPRRVSPDERAATDFADHEAAAQQLGVDAARGRDRDLPLIGKAALRRQAVAGLSSPPLAISAATVSASFR